MTMLRSSWDIAASADARIEMRNLKESEELVRGLRALELFARLAPVGVEAYAKAGDFALAEASALISAFEDRGFAQRLPADDVFDLQPIAAELLLAKQCRCHAKATLH